MQFYPSGTRIANRYEVAGRPLVGGMGVVYLCFDHEEQRPVALKTFKPEFLPDRAARERFLEEGNTWVRLGRHPHIVHAYTVERIGDGREVYLVLELVAKEEGRRDASLRSWLTSGQPLPASQVLLITLQIVRGMRHAVETIPGFVHRDLKPENVLVGADRLSNAAINRVRVTDFGLVRGLRAEQAPVATPSDLAPGLSRLTRIGSVVGTPPYMAPEQWEGADVTLRADIYAVGCILGEMLSGRMLVRGGTLDELRRAHQGGQAWARAQAAVPTALRDLLAACLAVEPDRRYQDWAALEGYLAAAYAHLAGQPVPEPEAAGVLSRAERLAAGWSYNAMGASYLDMGNARVAVGYFERAHHVGQVEGERGLEAAGLNHLGLAFANLGDARRALGYFEQALAIFRNIGDRRGEGADLGNLGSAYLQLGNAPRAIDYTEQALAIAREIGDGQGESVALHSLGNAYREMGDAWRAVGCYEQAFAILREVRDRYSEGTVLGDLGNAFLQLGDTRRAIRYYEMTLTIQREIGDRRGEGGTLNKLGVACKNLGDARRAIGYFEQALAIAQEIGDRHGEHNALSNLGIAHAVLSDNQRTIGYFEQALAIAQETGDRQGEGATLGNLANVYMNLGDARRSIDLHEQALAIHREIGNRRGEGADLGNLGSAHFQVGDLRRAIGYYEQALAIHREVGNRRDEGNVLIGLGIVHKNLGDAQKAMGYYEQALTISRDTADVHSLALVSFNMALLHAQQDHRQQATLLALEASRLFIQMGHVVYAQHAHQLLEQLERQED